MLFAEVMLMHISCLRLNVHSAGSRSGCPGNQLLTGSGNLPRFQFSRYTFNNCEIMLKLAQILVNGPTFNNQNTWSTGEARHVSCSVPAAERVHYDRMRSLTHMLQSRLFHFKAMRPTNIYKLPRTLSKMIHIIPHCIRENNLFHFTWKQIK